MVQRRSARFVHNNFNRTASVTLMLNRLNWPTVELRRNQAKLHMFYKIINNLISVPHDQSSTITPARSQCEIHTPGSQN